MNMKLKREMPAAEEIKTLYPMSKEMIRNKAENDRAIREIFTGERDRMLVLIGPCSADSEDPVLEYVARLREMQERLKERLLIVPRIYTNKPRTTGDGYKGMLHQPDPGSGPDMVGGVTAIRRLHIRVLYETGFSGADEMLYPENYHYLDDCLSYVAIGARSVENQQHRLVASGLDVPVGMKNPTSGELSVMMNSVIAAQHPHTFVYSGWEAESRGNPLAHAILRGFTNDRGRAVPNFHYEDLQLLCELYAESGADNPAAVIDTNHSNSGKHWEEQPRIALEVLRSRRHSAEIGRLVKGLMIESYLEDGCRKPGESGYGCSITDPCLGWKKTERMLYDIAEQM